MRTPQQLRFWTFYCSVLLVSISISLPIEAQEFEIQTHTLKNGMKVLIQPDHSIPNVALYITYRIGSRNERPGTTGLSHFFEHMMFNGAKRYGPGVIDKVMSSNGGSINAMTTQDITIFMDWFPRTALPLVFDIESDRMQNLSLDSHSIQEEREVVASERRTSVDASNDGILGEQLQATAYIAHPYQWPVIGWPSDIQNWTLEDLRHHYEIGYSPSNATMVVVGDVTVEEVLQLCEKYIEPIPARTTPPLVTTVEPEQLGERRLVVHKPAELPLLELAYHVPQATSPDYYALHILRTILFDGLSSRTYRRLVDKDQIAVSVGAFYPWALDPTLLTINVQPREGISPEQCEKAVQEEIARLKTERVTDREMQKAINMRLVDAYQQVRTISGRADAIGAYEVFFGDYKKLFSVPDNYKAVTAQDVLRVANKYFSANNLTVATLMPDNTQEGKQ